MASSYEDLVAWQKAMKLVTEIYHASENFPKHEAFGLTTQLRRAAVSVPSNIAEGQGRLTRKDFRHFLATARGSLQEMQTQLRIAENLHFLGHEQTQELLASSAELGRILNGLMASIKEVG
ncbi:MAG TPA: four helix bundle protein [Terriglobales bacterium]|nr:four helix bundle protein [Terriglobales bacterium]